MSRLPNILSLLRIVGGITLLLCDVVGTTFQKKTKKLLTRPLGHVLTLRLISKSAASLSGTRDKKRVPSPLV